jgi:hypothetical protein
MGSGSIWAESMQISRLFSAFSSTTGRQPMDALGSYSAWVRGHVREMMRFFVSGLSEI